MFKGIVQGTNCLYRARVQLDVRLLCAIFFGAGVLGMAVFCAAPRSSHADTAVKAAPRSKLDVVLMLDASGSMLKTDPGALRYEGAKLLTSFLTEGDRLGIVQFSGDAKVVQELGAFDPKKAEQLIERIRAIPVEGEFTDITEGIKVSSAMLDKAPQANTQRVIVVLSDGKVEPNPAVGPALVRTLQLVQEMLPELKAKEIRIFTVALSEQADRALLGEVAAATDGLTWYTQTADEMHKTFSEMFLALKRPQVVPQTSRGFSIDADIAEATFYINHASDVTLSLVSPTGDLMTAERHPDHVTWFAGQNFDVITVAEPELGDWGVAGGVTEDGFATVLTDLKLLTDWPLIIRAGDEPLVQARFYEDNKPVVLPEIGGIVKLGFQIIPTDKVSKPIAQEPLSDDGARGDVIAQDGIFSARAGPLEVGSYKLTVVAKGPTFQRTQQIPFTVRQRLVTISVRSPVGAFVEGIATPTGDKAKAGVLSGTDDTEFSVALSKEVASLKSFKVTLVAVSEDRRVTELPLKQLSSSSRDYEAVASTLPISGLYRVKAVVQGIDKKGERVEAESQIVTLNFSAGERRAVVTPASDPHEHEGLKDDKPASEGIKMPVLALGIISVFNALVFLVVQRIVKSKRSSEGLGQRYLPPVQMLEAIESLENRASATSIAAEDPLLAIFESMSAEANAQQIPEELDTPKDIGGAV
jgi:Mg-chelatase subunit ChlD